MCKAIGQQNARKSMMQEDEDERILSMDCASWSSSIDIINPGTGFGRRNIPRGFNDRNSSYGSHIADRGRGTDGGCSRRADRQRS